MLDDHPNLEQAIAAKGARRTALWAQIADHRRALLPIVHAYREALADDGWKISKTYKHEPAEHAWTAEREGFKITGIARPVLNKPGKVHKPSISGWGPDGAAIGIPFPYCFANVQAALRVCDQCGAEDVGTDRYAFANRCCAECGPKFMKSLPTNWAN